MLAKEQNELLTRTGPGTRMGDVMRRYWVPALLSWELPEPDCAPLRLKLLGEQLVAFRDSAGRVGILDELCSHRCASLFLGRNEEGGLRCVFHGWKYDVEGNCVDMPNEPAETDFKERVHQTAYPAVDMGGIIWAYMGPKELQPPFPKFEFTQVPETQRQVTKTWEECNWLQGLEGGIDSVHSSFLHRAIGAASPRGGLSGYRAQSVSARLELDLTDYGYRYVSLRPLGEQGDYARLYHFVMPWTQIRASQGADGFREWKPQISGHFWVPIDDENHMVWNWTYRWDDQPFPEADWTARQPTYRGGEQLEGFRKVSNRDNNWRIDRQVQKHETFTGIDGINTQDHAVQESMGPIVDRSREHLGTTDRAVVASRLLLLKSIATVEAGDDPPGLSESYHGIRAIEQVLEPGVAWRDALLPEAYPAGLPVSAGA
jgi:phthalate 4,5-dioxygenase